MGVAHVGKNAGIGVAGEAHSLCPDSNSDLQITVFSIDIPPNTLNTKGWFGCGWKHTMVVHVLEAVILLDDCVDVVHQAVQRSLLGPLEVGGLLLLDRSRDAIYVELGVGHV